MPRKNSKQKKRTVTNQRITSAVSIPSDSEDSALSESEDEDECIVLNKKAKLCVPSQRILQPEDIKSCRATVALLKTWRCTLAGKTMFFQKDRRIMGPVEMW